MLKLLKVYLDQQRSEHHAGNSYALKNIQGEETNKRRV